MEYLLIALLLFLPLIVIPSGASYFEIPKVIIAEILIQAGLFIILIKTKKFGIGYFRSPQLILASFILGLTILHLFIFQTREAFFGNVFRLQGIFLTWHLTALFLIFNSIRLQKNLTKGIWVIFLFLFLSVFLYGNNEEGRRIGSLGEPNSLAATSLFLFPFLFLWSPKLLKIICLGITILIIYLAGSRSGAISLGLQLLFLSLLRLRFSIKKAFAASLAVVLVVLIQPFLITQTVYENRAEIWRTALIAGQSSPLVGNGFGNVTEALRSASWKVSNNVRFQYIDSSHNLILDYWVQGGIIGLGLIVSIFVLAVKQLIKRQEKILLTSLLGVFVMSLFNPLSVVNLVELWWLLSQGFSNLPFWEEKRRI